MFDCKGRALPSPKRQHCRLDEMTDESRSRPLSVCTREAIRDVARIEAADAEMVEPNA